MSSFKTIQFYCLRMGIVLFLAAICFVVAAIQLKTENSNASPPETSNKNSGLTPGNQWNSAVRHPELTLSQREQKSDDATHYKPKQLVVQHTGEHWNSKEMVEILERSVFAVQSIPTSGIFYYEVKIERKKGLNVNIGLATNQMELYEGVGHAKGTYAYDSNGNIWGHEVEGCAHGVNKRPFIRKGIPFEDGHVVGCGVDLEKGQIFYTKNGEIVTAGLSVDAKLPLFPCVTLTGLGQKIEANFGPDFLFNPAVIEKLRTVTRTVKRKKLPDATHSESKQLVVEHTGEPLSETGSWSSTGSRKFSIALSWLFSQFQNLEFSITKPNLYIGLATRQMKLNEGIGLAERTYAYDSSGIIWGHEQGCT